MQMVRQLVSGAGRAKMVFMPTAASVILIWYGRSAPVKEAVRFCDPMNGQPENIEITNELKRSVRSAHAAYKARLETEKREDERGS